MKNKSSISESSNAGRRSFIRKTGAVVTAALASAAAGVSKTETGESNPLQGQVDQLSRQLGILKDVNAVRNLHKTYESRLDRQMYEEVVELFSDNAEVSFDGGVFKGRKSLQRLYAGHFSQGMTGKKIEPAPGFEPQAQEVIEVAEDRRTAAGRFPYSMQVGAPMTGNSSLVEMARLQGEGIIKWWEGGVCDASFIKSGDGWKISRIEYRPASEADSKPVFTTVFPKHPTGPDRLIKT